MDNNGEDAIKKKIVDIRKGSKWKIIFHPWADNSCGINQKLQLWWWCPAISSSQMDAIMIATGSML